MIVMLRFSNTDFQIPVVNTFKKAEEKLCKYKKREKTSQTIKIHKKNSKEHSKTEKLKEGNYSS